MRILTIHNHYGHYTTGGEGNVFNTEADLLEKYGHTVKKYTRTNSEVMNAGFIDKIKVFREASWSKKEYESISHQIERFKPDVVHVHNFFLIISPSVFRAAKDAGIPTVATLHNYRLLSPCSQLIRKGKICELCINKNPWRIMLYRCYRNSFLASFLRYKIYYLSKKKYNWPDDIDAFIALTQFGKDKFIEGGLPEERIFVKPNFISDLQPTQAECTQRKGAIFVGRLSSEKGLKSLMIAWRTIDYPLVVFGDGPIRKEIEELAPKNVSFKGIVNQQEVLENMRKARFLVFPSEWYEGFPCVLVESMAMGLPVIASNLGAMAEIIENGHTGLLFELGNIEDIRIKAQKIIEDDQLAKKLGENGRQEYLEKYTSEINYKILMNIYSLIIRKSKHTIEI